MTLTTESLRAWLANGNLQSFLRVIRSAESSLADEAYRTLYGGALVDDISRHPNRVVTAGGYSSTAAGAYQILYGTWKDFCTYLGETPDTVPFSEEFQDLCAVWLINRRGALQDVAAGRFDAAIAKCNREWASFPGSPYGQPTRTIGTLRAVYEQHGGTYSLEELLQPAAPIEDRPQPSVVVLPEPQQESFMAPIFAALLPSITAIVPELLKIFGADAKSDTAKRNVAVAGVISNAFIKASDAVNLQDAVEKAQSSPEIAAKVRAATLSEPSVQLLTEIGGGIEAARKQANDPTAPPFWRQGAFVVALVLTPLIYMTVYRVLWSPDYSEQLRTVVVTAILSGLLGALTGYFFGSMYSSSTAARRTTDEPKTA